MTDLDTNGVRLVCRYGVNEPLGDFEKFEILFLMCFTGLLQVLNSFLRGFEMINTVSTKKDEKVARGMIRAYESSKAYRLSDVYGKYSHNKARAWRYCEGLYTQLNGYGGLRILSHNVNVFTVGFTFTDKETGIARFAYITRNYNRFCNL